MKRRVNYQSCKEGKWGMKDICYNTYDSIGQLIFYHDISIEGLEGFSDM